MELSTPLRYLPGVGPAFAKRLARLGLFTVEDLIHHYPFRYDDFSKISQVSEAKVGDTVTFQGDIWSIKNTYTRFRKVLTKAILNDGGGSIELVWFNQPWLTKNIPTGNKLQVSGKIARYGSKISLVSPDWEKVSGDLNQTIHTGRLVPVYPETYGISSRWLRQKIAQVLEVAILDIIDPLPSHIRNNLLPLDQALAQIHFPESLEKMRSARARLAFDELFYIQLTNASMRTRWQQKKTVKPLKIPKRKLAEFIGNLPFSLTKAQKRVIEEITTDLEREFPMNRLLQGEVGSGKTVVATAIIYLVNLAHLKSVVMAPTEILAFQHFDTLTKLLGPYGIKIGIYTGSRKFTKKDKLLPDVIVGTHALLSEKLILEDVGLIVIDEQQRFGVKQRGLLRNRAKTPHFLTMTATPIPRTVALTLYGDLDLSVIDELPKGRRFTRTHFVPANKRNDAYKFIESRIKKGQQAYIITPLIEASETLQSAKAAKVEYERLKKSIFPDLKLGLLHGRLKSKEKEQVINDFKDKNIDILVSTSVVEVGIDIPNATIMVIEGAERFGLAQLHQLRGRVGRGKQQSYALMFSEQEDSKSISRIKHLEKIYDGLKLAEMDLKIRGAGEVFGIRQSGRRDLRIASLNDIKLIEQTKQAANQILGESLGLDKYPLLAAKLFDRVGIMPD